MSPEYRFRCTAKGTFEFFMYLGERPEPQRVPTNPCIKRRTSVYLPDNGCRCGVGRYPSGNAARLSVVVYTSLTAEEFMLRSTIRRCVLIAGFLLLCNGRASASIIVNGDFEGGAFSQTFGSATDSLPNSWTNSPPTALSNLNVFANGTGPGSAESGMHYVAFQSTETDGTQDCLNQIVTTVPNQRYAVTFWVGMTASSGSQFGLSPEWDAGGANDTTMGTTAFYYHPTNSPAVTYTFFSFTETASSSSTSIYFHGADATGAVLLDNVAVTPVPEPGSLASAALLAFFALLRRPRATRQYRG